MFLPISILFFLPLIPLTASYKDIIITKYRCFVDWMTKCDNCSVRVRHVGLHVYANDKEFFMENLGDGTDIYLPREVSCFNNCFDSWRYPLRKTTLGELKNTGGTGYKVYWGPFNGGSWSEKNNCYDARDRMLLKLGDDNC